MLNYEIGVGDLPQGVPAWPSWPPLALPDLPRRLKGARAFFFNPSLEGGFELFADRELGEGIGGLDEADRWSQCSWVMARTSTFSLVSLTRFSTTPVMIGPAFSVPRTTPQSISSLKSSPFARFTRTRMQSPSPWQ